MKTCLWVQVCGIKVDYIDLLALDRRMQYMLRRCTEISTVQVSVRFGRSNQGRPERAIAAVHGLLSFEEEEAGAWACSYRQRFEGMRVNYKQWLASIRVT